MTGALQRFVDEPIAIEHSHPFHAGRQLVQAAGEIDSVVAAAVEDAFANGAVVAQRAADGAVGDADEEVSATCARRPLGAIRTGCKQPRRTVDSKQKQVRTRLL